MEKINKSRVLNQKGRRIRGEEVGSGPDTGTLKNNSSISTSSFHSIHFSIKQSFLVSLL